MRIRNLEGKMNAYPCGSGSVINIFVLLSANSYRASVSGQTLPEAVPQTGGTPGPSRFRKERRVLDKKVKQLGTYLKKNKLWS